MNLLAATQLAIDSAWAVYFVGAVLVIGGAAGVVLGRNPVHCALSLVTTIFGIALIALGKSQTGERPTPAGADESKAGEVPAAQDGTAPVASPGTPNDEDEEWIPPKHALPFGPFLALAGVEMLFFGPQLLDWYDRTIARLLVR